MIHTAGAFDRQECPIYFLASGPSTLSVVKDQTRYILIAVNELKTEKDEALLEAFFVSGHRVLMDSGVYTLAADHARLHGIPHDQALKLPLDQIDGFPALYQRYVRLAKKYGSRVWGYIELDLGGRDQKRATRHALHDLGLSPIPVYHPLNDGWEYFDELASQYDRICVGNIVQASGYIRLRLLATIYERKRAYPHLWVHLLGLTANEWLCAYPVESCDSSSWLSSVRWNGFLERACLKTVGPLPKSAQYKLGERGSWELGLQHGALGGAFITRNFRAYLAGLRAAGIITEDGVHADTDLLHGTV